MADAELSCVICTRNRRDFLRAAIESLVAQDCAPEKYEILVVDNGSTDGTSEMIRSVFGREPRVRVIHEPVVGLSCARNAGWRAARGAFVAYLDDDAVADPGWVTALLDVFHTVVPQPGCVGGPIDLMWEGDKPEWVPFDFYCTLGFWYHGHQARTLDVQEYNPGGNMALPRAVLERINGFDVRLGRQGGGLLSNEELLVQRQVRAAGDSCYYAPAARVKHWAHASRLRPGWFMKRMFWQGVSESLLERLVRPATLTERWRMAATRMRRSRLTVKQVASALLTWPDRRRVCQNGQVMRTIGAVAGCMAMGMPTDNRRDAGDRDGRRRRPRVVAAPT